MIYLFTDKNSTVAQVGGKGFSLIKMAQAGFNVPPGMVLSVDFFQEWLNKIDAITELRLNKEDSDTVLQNKLEKLKSTAGKFEFSANQKKIFSDKLKQLGSIQLFSVRSSSPEEDMAGASFAGMYETYLGIKPEELEINVRKVFLSCIDYRVLLYKKQHHFDYTKFSIAVVVMAQIKSQVAGVAFSVNPLNNCYDEIVINANFGVGESVVSGDMVPDQFIVDKYEHKILLKKIGEKQVSIVVQDDGGTKTLDQGINNRVTLSEEQILELASTVKKIEDYYGMPMDTEWAYANNQFYMIQARPITTIIPLHPAFLTAPGKPKVLYLDLTLVEQGIQKPLSVMGTDCFRILTNEMGKSAVGVEIAGKPGDLAYAAGGRAYINLSNDVLLEGQKQAAAEYEGLDSYAAEIIRGVDMQEYRGHYNVSGVWMTAKALFAGLVKSWDLIREIMEGNKQPEKMRAFIDEKGSAFIREIDALDLQPLSFGEFTKTSLRKVADLMIHVTISSLIDGQMAKGAISKLFDKKKDTDLLPEVDKLDRALPYNVTLDMSCRIYELAQLLDKKDLDDLARLQDKIQKRECAPAFLEKWDEFMRKYGFRAPREVDIRTARYQDNPVLLLKQMQSFAAVKAEASPQAMIKKQTAEREAAFKLLLERVKQKKKLEQLYTVLLNLGGYREIHKYYLVYVGEKIRYKALKVANDFLQARRIDVPDDIFYLTVEEAQKAIDDKTADVRGMIARHKSYMVRVEQIENFPPIIDSRGKILRPKRKKPAAGELVGDPISAGVVKGKVKIVNFVGEKEILPGDILVAKAADPGWTPLFINASGILLEVGGMLQHGSLIAREYGKPCIVGMENLVQKLKDGDLIEMDGATGSVKIKKAG